MSHVPRLDLLYPRARRRRHISVALSWLLVVAASVLLSALIVRQYLHYTVGARRALIAARQSALAQARSQLSGIEQVSVIRSEGDGDQFTVTGEGTNSAGIRCRFVWRSSPTEPGGTLSIEPFVK